MTKGHCRALTLLAAVFVFSAPSSFIFTATAQESFVSFDHSSVIGPLDPNEHGDGTLGSAAREAIEKGFLPTSDDYLAAKAAANARAERQYKFPFHPVTPFTNLAAAPTLGWKIEGNSSIFNNPSDSTGAMGKSSFIQLVNGVAEIYTRGKAKISLGTLKDLAGVTPAVQPSMSAGDPRVIWDTTTQRFYYSMYAAFSSTDNRVAFGFSKTSSPTNLTTDWCHYSTSSFYGSNFPDQPRLGDSANFLLMGVNVYTQKSNNEEKGTFIRSDIIGVNKPTLGIITVCPTVSVSYKKGLVDASGLKIRSPVPADQIDSLPLTYIISNNGSLPSNKIWFFAVKPDAITGKPLISAAKLYTTGNYKMPPSAVQPGPISSTFSLETHDTRFYEAVQAWDPVFGTYSIWATHTVGFATPEGNFIPAVRWYEIDPAPLTPVIKNGGTIYKHNTDNFFNGAISPDRAAGGRFGRKFVIHFNHTSPTFNINSGIEALSATNGQQLAWPSQVVFPGAAPYEDSGCASNFFVCRWGDYATAKPDPYPPPSATSNTVWGTSQYSPLNPDIRNKGNWKTEIFTLVP